jgi:thiamine pyrophosphate-dependent acetolactate synthase large subunit-like protein
MQQVPRREQNLFARITSGMGGTYTLTEPRSVFTALKWGFAATRNPAREQPFFLLVPMNSQPRIITGCNLDELPRPRPIPRSRGMETAQYSLAAELIAAHERVVVKTGGGARDISPEVLKRLLDLTHAVYVHGPNVPGLLPDSDPRSMTVGGSKGSISGNYAMEHADLLIAVGARGVCQWDSSGTAWKTVKQVISINSDPADILQYNRTLPLPGDAELVISRLNEELEKRAVPPADTKMADAKMTDVKKADAKKHAAKKAWLAACRQQRLAWDAFCRERWEHPVLTDPTSGQALLTQPAAIRVVIDFADAHGAVKIFDAGDVQANGFQALHDQRPGQTYNDTGSSYMGFAVSALLASALVEEPEYPIAFTGDGSFMMNPQILIDGVEHGLRGMIVLFDNRRMAAISALQKAQYGIEAEFATSDTVFVNYLQLASAVSGIHAVSGGATIESLSNALLSAYAHPGLSLVHVPVYYGDDPLGGLGVFGSWNVGNWCDAVEEEKHRIGL